MKKIADLLTLVAAFTVAAHAVPALAAPTKVWVAKGGTDSASCGAITAPCRTFQRAHDNIAAGGAISVLTPGDYAPVIIAKPVFITNDGAGEAGIIAASQEARAITINASAGDIVGLRGLVLDGANTGQMGIEVVAVGALHVQNCVVRNFQSVGNLVGAVGIEFAPITASKLFVSDTLVVNNGQDANGGIHISAQHGGTHAVLNRVRVESNVTGIAIGDATVVIRDSVISGNAGSGIDKASAGNGIDNASGYVFIKKSALVGNDQYGLVSGPNATTLVSGTTITRNGQGINNGVVSYVDNEIDNNIGSDGAPTGFFAPR